jgi:signal transduction histidine kinase
MGIDMMLVEWIANLLKEEKRPLTANEIAEYLRLSKVLSRDDDSAYSTTEVLNHVENYPSIFQVFGGWVVLTSDRKWQTFISNYSYLAALMRDALGLAELQFVVAALVFYKRLIDFRGTPVYTISPTTDLLDFAERNSPGAFVELLKSLNEIDRKSGFSIRIFSDLSRQLLRMPVRVLREVLFSLRDFETQEFSNSEFAIAFAHLFDISDGASSRKPTLARTPQQVVEVMVSLLDAKRGVVLDPVCGTGGLLARVAQISSADVNVRGYEINEKAARFAYMLLFLQAGNLPDVTVTNCFSDLNTDSVYDYILADLPLVSSIESIELNSLAEQHNFRLPKRSRSFAPMLLYVYTKLSRRGKAVLTVSESFLSSAGLDESIRQMLITEDAIEAVISLPPNSLRPYTNGKASIIVLNKSKPSYLLGRVKFIDATGTKHRGKSGNFDTLEIIDSYRNKELSGRNQQLVALESIRAANTLQVTFYTEKFHQVHELFSERGVVSLGELVVIKRGGDLIERDSVNHPESIPFVRIENLERDILDMGLSAEGFRSYIDDPTPYDRSLVASEALLVARIGDNLKPTYFRPTKTLPAIVVHSNVLILSPLPGMHNAQINFEYLYYQLYSSFVQKQVERKRQGAVMPFISIKSLKSLLIPFMEPSAQAEFVATQKANIIATERERVNQRLKLIGFEERDIQKESDIVSTLVHELRPKLVGMYAIAKKIARIVEKRGISDLVEYDVSVSDDIDLELGELTLPAENMSMRELGEKLVKESEDLSKTLTVVQSVMNFTLKREELSYVDLFQFISDYFAARSIDINDAYSYEVRGSSVMVDINLRSFEQLLDQLLANAMRHAFKAPSVHNRVSFVTREDKERRIAIVDYSNNGAPFMLTEQDFVGFFHKSKDSIGSGIGGNFVYRVVKAHGGDLRVREEVKKGFFMRIELPLRRDRYEQ